MTPSEDIARSFSGHRFDEAADHLAEDMTWYVMGADPIRGRDAVLARATDSVSDPDEVTTTFERFLVVPDPTGTAVAVDAVARYVDRDGSTVVVASCDFYELRDGAVTTITSYYAELDPADSSARHA